MERQLVVLIQGSGIRYYAVSESKVYVSRAGHTHRIQMLGLIGHHCNVFHIHGRNLKALPAEMIAGT